MAGDLEVAVEDDAVVTVDVAGLGLDDEQTGTKAPSLKEIKDAAGGGATPKEVKQTAADEAAAALTKAQQDADAQRRTAEAANATAAAERARADEATRLAQQANEEARTAREQAKGSDLARVTSEIEGLTRDIASAKTELQRALEAAEFPKVAEAQAKLAEASADLSMAKRTKADLEAAAARPVPAHEGRVEPIQKAPFERYVTENNFSPAAQTWLRNHPDCVPAWAGGDPTKNAKMMAGHYDALGKSIGVNTPEYFKVIEERLGEGQQMSAASETVKAGEAITHQQPRKAPPVAAPPTREPPAADGSQSSPRSVRLTPQEQEVALFSYAQNKGEDETAWRKRAFGTYAVEKVKAQAEGKLGRMTH